MDWVLGIPLLLIVLGAAVASILRGVGRLLGTDPEVPPRHPRGNGGSSPA